MHEGLPGMWCSIFFFEVIMAFSGIDFTYDVSKRFMCGLDTQMERF